MATTFFKKYRCLGIVFYCFWINSCVEDFEPTDTETFENLIVIEAVITDEERFQEILVSRTTPLDVTDPQPTSGAQVRIVDNQQNEFSFFEASPGRYLSNFAFSAQPDTEYQLFVDTPDGSAYQSDIATLTPSAEIENFSATRITNEDGVEGVAITLDSFDPTGQAQFYRYQYEETYLIIAPFWGPLDAVIFSSNPINIGTEFRTQEERICYNTVASNEIIIASTNTLSEARVAEQTVRFLPQNDFIITNRYSILVRQFSQSRGAQTFYETLQEFSSSESLFSQTQPGFIQGNITAVQNTDENVLGLFEVASVNSERLFFNYDDLFPGETPPPFVTQCDPQLFAPNSTALLGALQTGNFKLILVDGISGEFFLVESICGDCTELGTNIRPDFWVD